MAALVCVVKFLNLGTYTDYIMKEKKYCILFFKIRLGYHAHLHSVFTTYMSQIK